MSRPIFLIFQKLEKGLLKTSVETKPFLSPMYIYYNSFYKNCQHHVCNISKHSPWYNSKKEGYAEA